MANVVRYSRPGVTTLSEAMDRLIRDAFTMPRLLGDVFQPGTGLGLSSNLYETNDSYVMQMLLPGAKAEEVQITAHRNVLTLQGTTAIQAPEGARGIWVGLSGGDFREQVALPGEVDAEGASAEYKDGILTLVLPKAEHTRVKTIKINAGKAGQPVIEGQSGGGSNA